MAHGTHQAQAQPTPVTDDAQATAPQLLARAASDYAQAQAHREQLDHEDRVHGQHPAA